MEPDNVPQMNDMNPSELIQYKVLALNNFTIKVDRCNKGIMVNKSAGEVVNILQNKESKDVCILTSNTRIFTQTHWNQEVLAYM